MRHRFAVAIHVDPDILLIDEVMAVGDEAFVDKCVEKIFEFKRRHKTIVLVTHEHYDHCSPADVEKISGDATVVVTEKEEVPVEVPVTVVVDPSKELDIYMVQHALCAWDAWWCTMKDAVENAEESLGVNVTVLGPDEFDLEKTAALIDQAVAAQPDGIAVTVTDPVLFKEPIQRAIEAGDAETGVCLMQMEAGLDTGPVLASVRCPIMAADTGGSLHDRLAGLAGCR